MMYFTFGRKDMLVDFVGIQVMCYMSILNDTPFDGGVITHWYSLKSFQGTVLSLLSS